MLSPLAPTAALRADLARCVGDAPYGTGVSPVVDDGHAHLASALGTDTSPPELEWSMWLQVATLLGRVSRVRGRARVTLCEAIGRLADVAGAPTESSAPDSPEQVLARLADVWRAVAAWGSTVGTLPECEIVLREVEAMERAGGFQLALTCVSALQDCVAPTSYALQARLLAQRGRIVRQLGDLEAAEEHYRGANEYALRAGDDDVVARAAIGLGNVFGQRGNYPAARAAYRRALDVAPTGSMHAAGAHHGLMLAALAAEDHDAAFEHGWRAFEGARGDRERRSETLINLGTLCRAVGHDDVAYRTFCAGLALATTSRLRVAALRGAALVAARLGTDTAARQLALQLESELEQCNEPYECARSWLYLGETWELLGDAARAANASTMAQALATRHGYHELTWRSSAESPLAPLSTPLAPPSVAAPAVVARPEAQAWAEARPRPDFVITPTTRQVLTRLALLPLHPEELATTA